MSLLPEKFYLDDFFDDFVPMPKMPKNEMKCDIYEKGGKVHIELDVPGFNKEDVKVDLDDGILTIAATKHEDKEEKARQLEMLERKIQGSLTKIEETDGDTYLTVVTSNPNTLLKKYK